MGAYYTTTALGTYLMGTNTADTETSALMSSSIDDAEREIAKYVSRRYNVGSWDSATSTPPMVKTWAQWLSAGYFYEATSRGGKEALRRSASLIKRATSNLKMVLDSEMDILDTAGSALTEVDSKYAVFSNTDEYAPTFAEDTASSWKVDSGKLSDIASGRS